MSEVKQSQKDAVLETRHPWTKPNGTVDERFAAIEDKVEQLELAYIDVAYEFTNNLAKRIEDIRSEVIGALNTVEEHVVTQATQKVAEATAKLNEVVENAKQSLSHDALKTSLAEHCAGSA